MGSIGARARAARARSRPVSSTTRGVMCVIARAREPSPSGAGATRGRTHLSRPTLLRNRSRQSWWYVAASGGHPANEHDSAFSSDTSGSHTPPHQSQLEPFTTSSSGPVVSVVRDMARAPRTRADARTSAPRRTHAPTRTRRGRRRSRARVAVRTRRERTRGKRGPRGDELSRRIRTTKGAWKILGGTESDQTQTRDDRSNEGSNPSRRPLELVKGLNLLRSLTGSDVGDDRGTAPLKILRSQLFVASPPRSLDEARRTPSPPLTHTSLPPPSPLTRSPPGRATLARPPSRA